MIAALLAALAVFGCESRNSTESPLDDPVDAIEFAALKFAMTSHAEFGREKEVYGYYVIERPDYLDRLKEFSPHVVINDGERFDRVNGVYQEVSTGKDAKLWKIHNHMFKGDSAEVWITWHSASLAGGGLGVKLKRVEGKWIATTIEKGPVS